MVLFLVREDSIRGLLLIYLQSDRSFPLFYCTTLICKLLLIGSSVRRLAKFAFQLRRQKINLFSICINGVDLRFLDDAVSCAHLQLQVLGMGFPIKKLRFSVLMLSAQKKMRKRINLSTGKCGIMMIA